MESFDGCSAVSEARGLYRMLRAGSTIEELRELIAVPAKTERVLRSYAQRHPEEAHFIQTTLKFRQSVAREFERVVREGLQVADLPKTDESVSCAIEQTFSHAQR